MLKQPYLLTVGTIEPRKCHSLILDAMENLWAQGHELTWCIAGKEGWEVKAMMKRIHAHPLLNKKLFFIESPSDIEVSELYQHAAGLLFMSKGEGFGLPLIEAANYGVPLICSDIPVFHEVAGDWATYVSGYEVDELANSINRWWSDKKSKRFFRYH